MANHNTKQNYVYLIHAEATRFVKIGVSNNPKARLKEVQTGCPFRCYVHTELPVVKGRAEEIALHALFKSARRNGEWFDLPLDTDLGLILDLIKLALRYPGRFDVRFAHQKAIPIVGTPEPTKTGLVPVADGAFKLKQKYKHDKPMGFDLRRAHPKPGQGVYVAYLSQQEGERLMTASLSEQHRIIEDCIEKHDRRVNSVLALVVNE